ncbi:hypothetical protein B7486_45700 [cyanobacterium TDX16]|nr:hypothetical protein B7486_45700 [cyanobacterium TDX16]
MMHPGTGDLMLVVGYENVRGVLANGFKIIDTPNFKADAAGLAADPNNVTSTAETQSFWAIGNNKKAAFPGLF